MTENPSPPEGIAGDEPRWVQLGPITQAAVDARLRRIHPRLTAVEAIELREPDPAIGLREVAIATLMGELFVNRKVPQVILPEGISVLGFGTIVKPNIGIPNSLVVMFTLRNLPPYYYDIPRKIFLRESKSVFESLGLKPFPPRPRTDLPVV